MDHSTSVPSIQPLPPATATARESADFEEFQRLHRVVGVSPVPRCEDPGKRWVAYWLADGEAKHVTGRTLGAVLVKLKKAFGT